jgi:signal peptidase II
MTLVLAILLRIYHTAEPRARLVAAALGLACGGAIGNIADRFRFPLGVVDFIDVGIGAHRFWTFNLADAGITIGALLLAVVLFRDEMKPSPASPPNAAT